jgi:hypothetical protein
VEWIRRLNSICENVKLLVPSWQDEPKKLKSIEREEMLLYLEDENPLKSAPPADDHKTLPP